MPVLLLNRFGMGDNLMPRKATKQKRRPAKAKTRKPRQTVDIDKLPLSAEQKEKRKAYRELAENKEMGDKQFYTWYRTQPKAKIKTEAVEDTNITLIKDALIEIKKNNSTFRIQRGGYLLKAGRAKKGEPPKFIVEPAPATKA